MLAAPAAWTPITRHCGFSDFTANATPLMRPPPPTGTIQVSISGRALRISRPIVPCPAITSSSSKGCMSVRPVSAAIWSALSYASSYTPGTRTTSAPYERVASTFEIGAPSGMHMTALSPALCAASATPWEWFPAEHATTPFAFSSSLRRWILLYAPLSLKEPVSCRFSVLRYTSFCGNILGARMRSVTRATELRAKAA